MYRDQSCHALATHPYEPCRLRSEQMSGATLTPFFVHSADTTLMRILHLKSALSLLPERT